MAGCKVDFVDVMTRSRVLLRLWVGKVTCCWRLTEDRRLRNCEAWTSDLSFTWILKSPVMRNSCGVVIAKDRKAEKSDRNVEKGAE